MVILLFFLWDRDLLDDSVLDVGLPFGAISLEGGANLHRLVVLAVIKVLEEWRVEKLARCRPLLHIRLDTLPDELVDLLIEDSVERPRSHPLYDFVINLSVVRALIVGTIEGYHL